MQLDGALWNQARAKAELLCQAKKNLVLEPIKHLSDGSYLSYIYPSWIARRRNKDGVLVRVMEYALDDPGRAPLLTYRLVTTILDPKSAPAADLAVLYCERQEFELAEDEMKTHQRGAGVVLRSRTPNGVAQEMCAYFLVHYAARALMTEAALQHDIDPERLSFTPAINVIHRKTIASPSVFFPRRGLRRLHQQVVAEILEEILLPRCLRSKPRVVKRKMSKFHVKRSCSPLLAPAYNHPPRGCPHP